MSETAKWIIGTIITVLTAVIGGGYALASKWADTSETVGMIKSDIARLKSDNEQLRLENGALKSKLEASDSSNSSSSSEALRLKELLNRSNERLSVAEQKFEELSARTNQLSALAASTTRCAPYREEIKELQDELAGRSFATLGHPPEPDRKSEIKSQLEQYQETLRICLSMKPQA